MLLGEPSTCSTQTLTEKALKTLQRQLHELNAELAHERALREAAGDRDDIRLELESVYSQAAFSTARTLGSIDSDYRAPNGQQGSERSGYAAAQG